MKELLSDEIHLFLSMTFKYLVFLLVLKLSQVLVNDEKHALSINILNYAISLSGIL